MARKYLDFEVIKESWDTYSLRDGTTLKMQCTLKSAWVEQDGKQLVHRAELSKFETVLCDPKLQGKPEPKPYTLEQLNSNVEVKYCDHSNIKYEPSEYLLDDGHRILIHYNIVNIARTTLYNAEGDRVYLVTAAANVTITPPQK